MTMGTLNARTVCRALAAAVVFAVAMLHPDLKAQQAPLADAYVTSSSANPCF